VIVSVSCSMSLMRRHFAGMFAPGVANDGTVAVDETKLDGMHAFAAIDATHTWIMNAPEARRLAVAFLRDGSFAAPVTK
jgi:hypothetical protein